MWYNLLIYAVPAFLVGVITAFLFSHFVASPIPYAKKKAKKEFESLKADIQDWVETCKDEAEDALDKITIDDKIRGYLHETRVRIRKEKSRVQRKLKKSLE